MRRRRSADKQSLKLRIDMLLEMRAESARLKKSLSWVAQEAWRRSKERIQALPSVGDVD